MLHFKSDNEASTWREKIALQFHHSNSHDNKQCPKVVETLWRWPTNSKIMQLTGNVSGLMTHKTDWIRLVGRTSTNSVCRYLEYNSQGQIKRSSPGGKKSNPVESICWMIQALGLQALDIKQHHRDPHSRLDWHPAWGPRPTSLGRHPAWDPRLSLGWKPE